MSTILHKLRFHEEHKLRRHLGFVLNHRRSQGLQVNDQIFDILVSLLQDALQGCEEFRDW
jgi:hypothetical protein